MSNLLSIKDKVAIVGIGETPYSRSLADSDRELAAAAIKAALQDAGIAPFEVDGLVSNTQEPTREVDLARSMGFGDLTFFAQVPYGGGAPCGTVGLAAMAIATGQARVAVVWRARKRGAPSTRPWAKVDERLPSSYSAISANPFHQWTRPWGLLRPSDEMAILTRRYMHEYGSRREDLASVALTCRANANRNPAAVMNKVPLSLDEYMDSRWIAEPLCLFDCCLETDGAAAVVMVPAERAVDQKQPPVYVHAFAQGIGQQYQTMTNYFGPNPLRGPSWSCGKLLWSLSDFGPKDVDVAQIFDAFTPLVLWTLEGFGFCGEGEAPDFVRDGNLDWPDGRLPINTAGGSLSEVYLHGFNLIPEAVKQLRGSSFSQVANAATCLVTSAECAPTSAVLLRGE